MAHVSAKSKSSGSTITISIVDLQNIIVNTIRMVCNVSYSSSLSALSSMSPSSWLMDSACCNHMTCHSSLFFVLKLAPHPLNICTANGSTMSGHKEESLCFLSQVWVLVLQRPNREGVRGFGSCT